jgi:hypothetical protein
MSPAKEKEASAKPKSKKRGGTFKDLDDLQYRHITAGKPSIFSKIFTDVEVTKTLEECKSCWNHLGTRNFQVAGD